jgi:hypothetical protein
MIHSIASKQNWKRIHNSKQQYISKTNGSNKSCIPYEYKVRHQMIETPGIHRKLSTSCTGQYTSTKAYKNGRIQIQKRMYHKG